MQAESGMRKLQLNCNEGGVLARLPRIAKGNAVAVELTSLLEWIHRHSLGTIGKPPVLPSPKPDLRVRVTSSTWHFQSLHIIFSESLYVSHFV